MDKLQEIISDLSLWHLASKEELKPLDINAGPCYIIEQSYVKDIMIGYMRKQQAIIEEHQRQQDVTVIQFRQAQEEIQRLTKENDRFRKAFHQFANMKIERTAPELVIQRYSRYAKELLEGRGLEGDAE
ncbi:hypothetical protein SJY89_14255 [Bacillus velezensis]|uniref:hypothetical protein n=1 Tax=Bacillus TaxID=1386 RepID=UPI0028F86BCE|nr:MULTISPECIES: hypothetical protein [Bacillus]MDU0077722.1 hypothetical protein [Bacillus sp. IG2]MDU0103029.1 hypothetical protein [Bacillus sp. IS1]MDX7896381.1 hypothetical protein [Bacillus velezensis]MDX8026852.1 hypothetical protein [Bacillus velezensis]MDX8200073.1 hypothetical protein [Bacillus velezensis]